LKHGQVGVHHLSSVVVLLLIPISLQASLAVADLSAKDPLVIDVLLIDRVLFQGWSFDRMLSVDPSISVLGVPMPGHSTIMDGQDPDYMNRVMRIYMPRSYEYLRETADMVLLREASCGSYDFPEVCFDAKWMVWFVRAVQEEGMSFGMWGGDPCWGGHGDGNYKSWGDTIIDEILPFESLGGYSPTRPAFNVPRFIDPEHGLARLPWVSAGYVELLNKVRSKLGSTLVAEAVGTGSAFPWIAWWESGKGRVVGETQVFGSAGGGTSTMYMHDHWEWYQDFVIYLVYFGVGKPVPDDIYRAHGLREEINTHLSRRSLVISLFEFVEKFGASTVALYDELEEINHLELEAEEFYRMDDYDSASEVFDEIQVAWMNLNARAIRVKENALVWVYVIEWITVTAASLIAGSVLWLLMVRRRLYREIGITRMRDSGN
jgi:hypothetical protein